MVVALRDGKDFENPLCSQLNSITLSYVALLQKWGAVCVWGAGRNPVPRNTAWDVINAGFELLGFTELSRLLGRERR